jgi:hypothetical protein
VKVAKAVGHVNWISKNPIVNDRFVINTLILTTTLYIIQCTNDLKMWMCYKFKHNLTLLTKSKLLIINMSW